MNCFLSPFKYFRILPPNAVSFSNCFNFLLKIDTYKGLILLFGSVGAACCPEGGLVVPTVNRSTRVVGDGIYGIDRV